MKRIHTYFTSKNETLSGWIHQPTEKTIRDTAIVICNPSGFEYTHSYRSVRHLADALANAGFYTLRFDFNGTGDSSGTDFDPNRIETWISNINDAAIKLKDFSGLSKISLIGIRFGGTLAALATQSFQVENLILWSPIINGRKYARELQAISAMAKSTENQDSSFIESAGFLVTTETLNSIKKIDLNSNKLLTSNKSLILNRTDLTEEILTSLEKEVETDRYSGFLEMMAEPQFTKIPNEAVFKSVTFLLKNSNQHDNFNISRSATFSSALFSNITESSIMFGSNKQLFGVLSSKGQKSKTALILFNSGAVHHVGPNRIYTTICREIASQGLDTFRIDLQGLGESTISSVSDENHPYPKSALSDARETLDYLKNEYGYENFILLGICSGAHTAFHSAILEAGINISKVVLINPLTFLWKDGMSLETSNPLQDKAYFRETMKKSNPWKRLFSGQIKFSSLVKFVFNQIETRILKKMKITSNSILSKNLKLLFKNGRKLVLVVSSGDPGYDLMIDEAPGLTRKAEHNGNLKVYNIENSDHTFTKHHARSRLLTVLLTEFFA